MKRGRLGSGIGAAIAAIVAAGALVVPASAGNSVASRVTLRVGDGVKTAPLYGRVISKKQECVHDRRVAILVPGQGLLDYADNRTNGKGKWVFSSQLQGATVVRAKVARSKSSGVLCRSALSPAKSL